MPTQLTGREHLTAAPNSREERVAASRYVLKRARSRDDLHELLDALGLNQTTTTPRKEAPRA